MPTRCVPEWSSLTYTCRHSCARREIGGLRRTRSALLPSLPGNTKPRDLEKPPTIWLPESPNSFRISDSNRLIVNFPAKPPIHHSSSKCSPHPGKPLASGTTTESAVRNSADRIAATTSTCPSPPALSASPSRRRPASRLRSVDPSSSSSPSGRWVIYSWECWA